MPRVFPLIKNDRGENSILTDTSTGYSLMKIQIWKQPEKKRVQTYSTTTTRLFKVFERIFRVFFLSWKFKNLPIFVFPVDPIQPLKDNKTHSKFVLVDGIKQLISRIFVPKFDFFYSICFHDFFVPKFQFCIPENVKIVKIGSLRSKNK